MSLDFDICAYVLRTKDLEGLITSGVKLKHFEGLGAKVFSLILKHYRKHSKVPSIISLKRVLPEIAGKIKGGNESLEYYVEALRQRSIDRIIRKYNEQVVLQISEKNSPEALELLQQCIVECHNAWSDESSIKSLDDLAGRRLETYDKAKSAEDGISGFRFPWPTLNNIGGGFHLGDYVLIVGDVGLGKTWTLNAIANCLGEQAPGLILSMEMDAVEFSSRTICLAGGFNYDEWIFGKFSPEEEERYRNYEEGTNNNIQFADVDLISDLDQLDFILRMHDFSWFIIDGLYLLSDDKYKSIYEKVGDISKKLKKLCLRHKVLGIGTTQWSGAERKAGEVGGKLTDLGYAKSQGQDANYVFGLVADQRMKEKNIRQLLDLKARRGKSKSVEINFNIDDGDLSEIREISPYSTGEDGEDNPLPI